MCIGACRAVWVPGQELGMPHLMCNCRKHILSLHCIHYMYVCACICYVLVTRVFASGPRDMNTHVSK